MHSPVRSDRQNLAAKALIAAARPLAGTISTEREELESHWQARVFSDVGAGGTERPPEGTRVRFVLGEARGGSESESLRALVPQCWMRQLERHELEPAVAFEGLSLAGPLQSGLPAGVSPSRRKSVCRMPRS